MNFGPNPGDESETPSVPELSGVFCPEGCGETLGLRSFRIVCLAPSCPRPTSAQEILADTVSLDIVTLGPGQSWTIQHPLRERLTGLDNCPVHQYLLENRTAANPGKYSAEVIDGKLTLVPLTRKSK